MVEMCVPQQQIIVLQYEIMPPQGLTQDLYQGTEIQH